MSLSIVRHQNSAIFQNLSPSLLALGVAVVPKGEEKRNHSASTFTANIYPHAKSRPWRSWHQLESQLTNTNVCADVSKVGE